MLPGIYATPRHLPGVRFAGMIHSGLNGTAPSAELIAAHANAVPPVAFPPKPVGQDLDPEAMKKIGARTIPGQEHGGNCGCKFLC